MMVLNPILKSAKKKKSKSLSKKKDIEGWEGSNFQMPVMDPPPSTTPQKHRYDPAS